MNEIIENYKHIVLEKYAEFDGRAARPEFWYFVLANIIISALLGLVADALANVYSLLVLLPSIAVGIRRMHDINRSGWWILFPLYNIYLAAQKGTEGANRFSTTLVTIPTAPTEVAAEPAPPSDSSQ